MSKQPIPNTGLQDDLPPPYSEQPNEHRFSSALQNTASGADKDGDILPLLVDPIDDFITRASAIRPPPKVIEGTFIPATALSPEWSLVDQGEKHNGELTKSIRVKTQTKENRELSKERSSWDSKGESSETKEFDDWGRWDEAGASAQSEETLWWKDEDVAKSLAGKIQSTSIRGMSVKADYVTFRRENEMGIWESESGWGVVVRLEL